MRLAALLLPLLLLWFGNPAPGLASPARIKDLVEIDGVRGNDLLGYGLVVGLNNTGDSLRNSPFTEDAIDAMFSTEALPPGRAASASMPGRKARSMRHMLLTLRSMLKSQADSSQSRTEP